MSAALVGFEFVVVTEQVSCVSRSCVLVFDEMDGWDGLCPSCAALRDEHSASEHSYVFECADCR